MLEYASLVLGPWSPSDNDGRTGHLDSAHSVIQTVPGSTVIGLISRSQAWVPPGLRWLLGKRCRLDICEAEDSSLLFTMKQRAVGGVCWDVQDADEQWLGTVAIKRRGRGTPPAGRSSCPALVAIAYDPWDQPVFTIDWPGSPEASSPTAGAIQGQTATDQPVDVTFQGKDWHIHFAAHAEMNPFLKMLILAAILALREE